MGLRPTKVDEKHAHPGELIAKDLQMFFDGVAAQAADYHRPAPGKRELDDVFHLETERVIDNHWVVRHNNRYFQVQRQAHSYAPAKAKVTVCEWEEGRLDIRYRGRAVRWEEIAAPAPPAARATKSAAANAGNRKPVIPKADHPWRQDYRKMRPHRVPGPPPALAFSVAASSASP
jgi:hypothetical protein